LGYLCDRCPKCGEWIEQCSPAQRTRFRIVCGDLAAQLDLPAGSGQKFNARTWKQILIAAWEKEINDLDSPVVPALDGDGFEIIFRRDSRLTKQEMSEVIEFAYAQGAQRGVRFTERRVA
jgi:hypothetical protein